MGYNVQEIQPTPNPNAAKFILDREISDGTLSFLNPAEGEGHPIASQLFSVKGVASVLLLGNFVTINKESAAKWEPITRRIRELLQKID